MFYNVISPINNLGYGIAGLNIVKTLFQLGFRVSLFPLGSSIVDEQSDKQALEAMVKNGELFSPSAPCIRIYHQFSMDMFVGRGPHIGFPIFELDTFTEVEKHHLGQLDAIFVCSSWAKKVVEDNGIKVPTFVVPLGVDRGIFYPNPQPRNDNATRFLNIGKWEERKGHNLLNEAFNKAFAPTDNVELWTLCQNDFIGAKNDEWKRKFLETPMGHRVRFVPQLKTQKHVAEVINKVDCGVFPTRAEGWCLPALDMMSCGKPVIITDYSGQTEFANKTNSLLIKNKGMVKAQDGIWFHGHGNWAEPDLDELVMCMQSIHQLKQLGKDLFNSNGVQTASKFSWQNTCKKIVEACAAL